MDSNTVKNDDGGQTVDVLTITGMHYLLVSLFYDLVWLLFLFIFMELSSVAAPLFALFHTH